MGKKFRKDSSAMFALMNDVLVKVVITYKTNRGGALDDAAAGVALADLQPEPFASVLVLAYLTILVLTLGICLTTPTVGTVISGRYTQ